MSEPSDIFSSTTTQVRPSSIDSDSDQKHPSTLNEPLPLLQPTPPALICLEEPELGMHPDMIRMVGEMIAEAAKATQIIVTTHSEHLLTALQEEFDALFVFDAGVDGSVVRRYSQEEYGIWREEHNLGELWTSGELGGNRW